MRRFASWLWPASPKTLTYMLQQFEYNPGKFLQWAVAYPNLMSAHKRGTFVPTKRAQAMLVIAYASYACWLATSLCFGLVYGWKYVLIAVLAVPAVAFVLFFASTVLQLLVVNPAQQKEIKQAAEKLSGLSATKIAVLGSYGKTTMKEILLTVLSEGVPVAATPGNKNVIISHARWINKHISDQQVLVVEYGEAQPGDIAMLAGFSKPDIAVITGIAPAHLDQYPTLESIADDLASVKDFVPAPNIFCNSSAELVLRRLPHAISYSQTAIAGWQISDIIVSFEGTRFTMKKDRQILHLQSGLLGAHMVGPLAAAVVIARQLGLTDKQIITGVAKTKPYEHRMEPRQLGGAWVIDDAYNGNIEGMKAGLSLLKALPAKRRIYVTPGLVDQGVETEAVHLELGRVIGDTAPDTVVLMQNSVTEYIQAGLTESGFTGNIRLESHPLEYYSNLDQHLAAGDVAMLQNDWPDSYK